MPVTPSEQEEEYFARLEFERRKKALAEQEKTTEAAERQRVLEVARNRCPKCGAPLVAITYRKIELDKCSSCGGLWFDFGELEQILTGEGDGGFLGGLRKIFG